MEAWKKRMITLHHCPHINNSTLRILCRQDPSLENIFRLSPSQISHSLKITISAAAKIAHFLKLCTHEKLFLTYKQNDIQMVTYSDNAYPDLLKEIYDPPLVLYAKGDIGLLTSRCIGVVGTRAMTEYGRKALQKVIPPLVKKGFTIVSGLARGIDTLSHQTAMLHKGKTIAVLGSGILAIYPKENLSLAHQISRDHLLLSEYPPYASPKKWHFPKRNRIISGLSEGILLIEAKEKSGSLITADQALDQGREVFAVPGSIMEPTSDGTNKLIQQGAKLVAGYEDILEELK